MNQSTHSSKRTPSKLTQLDTQCAGIDVGSAELYVCIAKNPSEQEVCVFTTFTSDIKKMILWLQKSGVRSVAMESTGVYWIPSYELLEQAGFEVVLVNARFLKAVPGRKTDVLDCQWLQQLHSYGLLRGSFRPSNEIVTLRSYVRQRSRSFESAAQQVQLMHKALTQMNIQLSQVMSNITGASGMNIIHAVLRGERDPKTLSELCVGGCRKNKDVIAKALEGNYRREHVFALRQACDTYEFIHKQIELCELEIQKILTEMQPKSLPEGVLETLEAQTKKDVKKPSSPYKRNRKKTPTRKSSYCFDASSAIQKTTQADLTSIPGIDANTAMKILAEIGTDMARWWCPRAFASWLGLCPGNKVSGGKVLNSATKPSNNKAAQALRQAAATLYNSKCYLGAFFRRIRARLGAPKAITALAHKLARIIYRMMITGEDYQEQGENYYELRYRERCVNNLTKRAKEMGYALVPVEC